MPNNKLLYRVALVLFLAQLVLMLLSWLFSALLPDSGVRSLIGSEGLRWFLGSFSSFLLSPLLVWLLLGAMAWGSLRHSGLLGVRRPLQYRERIALRLSLLLLIASVLLTCSLSLFPHALLLSATGSLWPSPFSASLPPLAALSCTLLGIVFGVVSGRYRSLSEVYGALLSGLRSSAPLLLFYVLTFQLVQSVLFVVRAMV